MKEFKMFVVLHFFLTVSCLLDLSPLGWRFSHCLKNRSSQLEAGEKESVNNIKVAINSQGNSIENEDKRRDSRAREAGDVLCFANDGS
jgi:hypothetical protein